MEPETSENESPAVEAAPAAPAAPAQFRHRLTVATLSLLFVVLVVHVLREFAPILQPLLVALFIGYAVLPVHHWLVERGIRPVLAYVVMFVLIVAAFLLLGRLAYSSIEQLTQLLPEYQLKLDRLLENLRTSLPDELRGEEAWTTDSILALELTDERIKGLMQQLLGTFFGFVSAVGVVAVYLLFLGMERASFPRRIEKSFSPERASQILEVVRSVNLAIGQYLAVKTLISFTGGVLTTLVLWLFGVDFYIMWGILAFLLNFIPYVGTLVAISLPIGLSLVQFDSPLPAFFIAVCLVIIHQGLALAEPRLAGSRLDVSPLLILLALAFWGFVWGITGMILAVPLLVTIKIVLENIPETRPIARLIAHL